MGQSGRVLRFSKGPSSGGEAEDVKRQVDNDGGEQKPIYELVNVKTGGGKLVDMIKSGAKLSSNSFSLSTSKSSDLEQAQTDRDSVPMVEHIDREIRDLVKPLLYNDGKGKLVALSEIWKWRLSKEEVQSETSSSKINNNDQILHHYEEEEDSKKYRWVCWKLEERGFVGETGLHICFLLSTPTHMILARKLLNLFPMLINDIYLCDQYFGESSLHMAIVHENVRIVKLLLDHGANVHERCLGSFFLPDDQKDDANWPIKRVFQTAHQQNQTTNNDSNQSKPMKTNYHLEHNIDLQSNHLDTSTTNFHGYAYWGEYPLSFAACLGSQDCYKLLLAKGANPNKQDSNGNSTLHMTVIANRKDMFDLCYANGANLDTLNKQHLTPLTLAAKLKRVDRQVNWVFCNVGFVEVPLSSIDSININDGSCNDYSALSVVVSGASNEHLEMLNGCLGQLLKIKWECGVRGKFYHWLYQFLLFLCIASLAYIKRFDTSVIGSDEVNVSSMLISPTLANNNTNNSNNNSNSNNVTKIDKLSSNLSPLTQMFNYLKFIHIFSEYLLVCYVAYYLWFTIIRLIRSSGFDSFCRSLAQAPEMSLFTVTCLLILVCIPFRLIGWKRYEDFMAALVMFTLPLKLLFFCRASMSVGSFVVMIYKIVVNDVLCFVVFLIIFVAGFSQYQKILEENHFVNLFDGLISMHMMALNEFGIVFDQFRATHYSRLAKVMFCIYMILVSILLINMLIAMLGKTYQDIASQPNESLRQWARALLIIERMWTKQERLQVLNRYSRLGSDGTRFYSSTWPLTQRDREQINQLNQLREENRVSAARLARMESAET